MATLVQSTFELYEYPCKKFPPHIRNRKDPPAPTAKEMCDYLSEYIDEKKMRSKFQFNTKVSSISCASETEWYIDFDEWLKTEKFTFVIVSNGLVSTKPNMIQFPGRNGFKKNGGIIMHSSERRSNDTLIGKRVLVVGNGKSAVDAAAAAADVAKANSTTPPIQMARRQTWYVPRYILGFLQYKWAFHTRIGSALLPRYYESSSILLRALHLIFMPVKWIVWRIIELVLLLQFRLPLRIWPKICTVERATLENSVLITDEKHLRRLRKGEVDMRIGTVESLKPGKAVLGDGRQEDVDVVILATGWKLAFDLFMDEDVIFAGLDYRKDCLDFGDDGLWLYRNILPAGFKGMAFVGSNTLTFMNIFTSYIQAYWVAQLLAGERPWPRENHMKETVQREKEFKRKYYPKCDMRGASVEAYMQHYHDVLFREMNARSPFKNCLVRPIANLFVPVIPALMKGCLEPERSLLGDDPHNSDTKMLQKHNTKDVEEGSTNQLSVDASSVESPSGSEGVPIKDVEVSQGSVELSSGDLLEDDKETKSRSSSVDARDLWLENCCVEARSEHSC